MEQFNVINYDFNKQKFESYDVIPYFMECYNRAKNKPKTFKQFKEFIKSESLYQFWARCQYEIILLDWPCQKHSEKWDIHDQILMNLDTITRIIMKSINKYGSR